MVNPEKEGKEQKVKDKFRLKDFIKENTLLILINGTSGSGKSTLSKKLAEKYGIKNILCTDNIRKKMRDEIPKEQVPIIHASTYETGYFLDQADIDRISKCLKLNQDMQSPIDPNLVTQLGCVRGYEIQCEMIESLLLQEIDELCKNNQSLIVEGVHVTESIVNKCFEKYPYCIPYMIYVKNSEEHRSRFAARCNGSMDPAVNKYVRHFENIRAIQKSINQIAIDSKFIKTDNDDAKRTFDIVHNCTKKYIKKLLKSEIDETSSLVIGRKRNMLYHVYESIIQKMNLEKSGNTKVKKTKKTEQLTQADISIWNLQNKIGDNVHPWFLKHMRIINKKSKCALLVAPPELKREKSAKKKDKFNSFKPLDIDMYKVCKRKVNKHKHQKSIVDAIRKYAKNSTNSKFSESTCCTITKVKTSSNN